MLPGRSTVRVVLAVAMIATIALNPMGMAAVEQAQPVGEAEAQAETATCYVTTILSPGLNPGQCGTTGISEAEIEETWTSIYTQAKVWNGAGLNYRPTYENAITDSSDTAFLQAEMAVVNAYQNGSTQIEAETAAREEIQAYYSVRQRNLLSTWNTQIATLENLETRDEAFTDGDVIRHLADAHYHYDGSTWTYDQFNVVDVSFGEKNFTLADNSEKSVRTLLYDVEAVSGGSVAWSDTFEYHIAKTSVDFNKEGNPGTATISQPQIMPPPDTEYIQSASFYPSRWNELWDKTVSKRQEVSGESDTFVAGTWDEFDSGQVNATELLSRLNLMENYQVDLADKENATFNDVVAALSAQGFSTPKSSTGWMNMTYVPEYDESINVTKDGMLLSGTAPPNGSWEIGTQYNSQTLNGTQLVATLDGQQHTINGTFTINGAYNESGVEIEDPTIESPERDYSVANVSELNAQIEALGDDLARLQNLTADSSSGGGGGGIGWKWTGFPDFLPDVPVTMIIAGLAVAAILAIFSFLKP